MGSRTAAGSLGMDGGSAPAVRRLREGRDLALTSAVVADSLWDLTDKRDRLIRARALIETVHFDDPDGCREADREIQTAVLLAFPGKSLLDRNLKMLAHAAESPEGDLARKKADFGGVCLALTIWINDHVEILDDRIMNVDPNASPAIGKLAEAIQLVSALADDPHAASDHGGKMIELLVHDATNYFPTGSARRAYLDFKLVPLSVGFNVPRAPRAALYMSAHYKRVAKDLADLRHYAKGEALLAKPEPVSANSSPTTVTPSAASKPSPESDKTHQPLSITNIINNLAPQALPAPREPAIQQTPLQALAQRPADTGTKLLWAVPIIVAFISAPFWGPLVTHWLTTDKETDDKRVHAPPDGPTPSEPVPAPTPQPVIHWRDVAVGPGRRIITFRPAANYAGSTPLYRASLAGTPLESCQGERTFVMELEPGRAHQIDVAANEVLCMDARATPHDRGEVVVVPPT